MACRITTIGALRWVSRQSIAQDPGGESPHPALRADLSRKRERLKEPAATQAIPPEGPAVTPREATPKRKEPRPGRGSRNS
ncbi:hypothetical protein EAS62_17340 [Bradyrhizobium zhanjiangense]|uniref:Uncharacterized protein n=1 Tax=Bradyrhizobium zhanjiangense TaxID=1325107 RepID=A0ABY0DLR3_9BRAD|nr:hypothetical protein EAS62_17340 [Bradyrhizobium zhanjiangense]